MKFLGLTVVLTALLSFDGLADSKSNPVLLSETDYYGADLTLFPPKIREWIMNVGFTKEKMEGAGKTNPKLKAWWSDDNNAVLFEASYIVAEGYVGAGTLKIWAAGSRYSGPAIVELYGDYAKYHTLKFKWELKQKVEWLLQNDPSYMEVIEFARQLCDEIEYDWANFSGYKGTVKRTPNKKYLVCEGYTNEVMERILKLNCIQAVQKWSSPGHAWNVIKLIDGRTLYFDLTWFDNEHIDEKTGEIYQEDDYDWANITFDEDIFRYANVGYGSRIFHHDTGKLDREIIK